MARTGTVGNYGDVKSATLAPPSACTVHAWWRSSSAADQSTYDQPVNIYGDDGQFQATWNWQHMSAGFNKAFGIVDSSSVAVTAQCTSTPATNTWHALGGTYNGTTAKVYLNGVNENSAAGSGGFRTGNDPRLVVRGTSSDRVAEAAFWSVALTDGEMKMLAAGVSPLYVRRASLIGYWPLYGTASPEPDQSGNGRNGTVTTMTAADHAPVRPLLGGELWLPYVVTAPQFARPASDISAGGWTASTGTALYAMIDEAVADDADYIQSATTPTNDTAEVALSDVTDPAVSTGHIIRIRARKPS